MKNKQNLELKHFCNDFKSIRKILKELGAEKEIIKKQKDYFFDLPQAKKKQSARMKLRIENNQMYLAYYERPDFIVSESTFSDIVSLNVDKNIFDFFKKTLGIIGIVEKKREVWRIKNTVFHLDTVKNVGTIFEVELQKKDKITEKDKKIFSYYQQKLMPFLDKVIKGSNIDLVLKK